MSRRSTLALTLIGQWSRKRPLAFPYPIKDKQGKNNIATLTRKKPEAIHETTLHQY